ncbi:MULTISPECIES: DUF423 domain-containing protein [Acidithiobacillus]|uniref:DUF423 domain-containing protein n=1 Tax=Acidithiobacillus TaxID=119977 RepID=UPI001C07E8BC|nr:MULTISPECIES: DUF423 domain-containing protein [Acidithiobacillus]MBU2847138.1 DUF423 domain-containing protein [Acidithiobacillus ferriphilus]MDA8246519.1 DUF423 domain-containing protein [Acidithiobacillus sp.]
MMSQVGKLFLALGAANAGAAVALGAIGAHALKDRLSPKMMSVYHTGSQYHLYHALGLMLVGLLALQLPESSLMQWSGGLMLAGTVLFSGSLYLLAITGKGWLGAITPIGGLSLISAWIMLAVGVLQVG